MRIVLQKVTQARVEVEHKIVGEIADGFVLLVGITHEDTQADADKLAEKLLKLRLCSDAGSDTFMERNIVDDGGGILAISQFTLFADTKKGTRHSFTEAARPEQAEPLFNYFVEKLKESNLRVETGEFGKHMEVLLVNDGPITIILDSKKNAPA